MQLISYKSALATGQRYYFTGKPCKNGHIAKRVTALRMCEVCYLKSRESKIEQSRSYQREYAKRHPEARVKSLSNPKAFPKWANQGAILSVYKKRDELNQLYGLDLEVDHIIPICSDEVCGLHCEANLQLLSKYENIQKGTFFQKDW